MSKLPPFLALTLSVLEACSRESSPEGRHGHPEMNRDYGYVIGDVIPMNYRFDLKGDQIDPESLPSIGPINDWLTIRRLNVEVFHHRDGDETRLHVDYQIFRGIRTPERLEVPSLSFRLKSHPETELETDAWSFTQVPVIPPEENDETITPHEGIGVLPRDSQRPSQLLAYWVAGLLGAASLMGLRQFLISRKARPFYLAQRQVRALWRDGSNVQATMEGMRLMHRAFDQTYGKTLFGRDVTHFVQTHPAYRDHEDELQQFFALSSQLFFNPDMADEVAIDHHKLIRLLSNCIRAERNSH